MARPKGLPKTGGRLPGVPNKTTILAKKAFELAFDGLGGVDGLITWGRENMTDFYKIYGRLIPTDMNVKRMIGSWNDLREEELAALSEADPDGAER